ncbi:MAG: NPCBM/NEW2 domain-containing protein [Tidjanibacter sp.]|nr:NPCBM/NEW2 domain-containing protein [Tidjanibacter sp.]
MKRTIATLIIILSATLSFAQTKGKAKLIYLDRDVPAVASHRSLSTLKDRTDIMLGGVYYDNAFDVDYYSTLVSYEYGYREFDLGGKYQTLTFIYGIPRTEGANHKSIMVVEADGRRIVDKIISSNDGNRRMSLDVEGVHKLRFTMAETGVGYGIAEPILWRKGQTPYETDRLALVDGSKPIMLCRDLMPWRARHTCYTSNPKFYNKVGLAFIQGEKGEIRLSGNSYENGILMGAGMALIGNNEQTSQFNLGGHFDQMSFIVGALDTDDGTLSRGWLTIEADGKIVYEKEIKEGELAQSVTVSLGGATSLTLRSEQAEGSLDIGMVDVMLYPKGYQRESSVPQEGTSSLQANGVEVVEVVAEAPAYLKELPDQCKLVSKIPPFAVGGGVSRENGVFTDISQYVTFSMGGIKYSEGVVLQSTTNFFHNNTGAHVMFNLGGEFDYVSFTTGWVGKCGVLKNDWLRVFADDELVLQVELIATDPNKQYLVPLNKCRVLKFEKVGMSSMEHPAFGLADMVVYRGEPKLDHGLFHHPTPECPPEIDLIDLNPPYIHYVSSVDGQCWMDGSSRRDYFSMPGGERIYKGFLLKTSVHFDIEMGPTSSPQAGIMAPMFGSSIMIGAVGNATIAAVSPFGAFLALAAGGTAKESSCAAFNTWGEYDMLTFTVACRMPHNTIDTIDFKENDPMETLKIGADGEVIAEFEIHDKMQPTTYTVPINKCHQLMFWLECGGWNSGQFIFYDLRLSKGGATYAAIPNIDDRDTKPAILGDADPYDISSAIGAPHKVEWDYPTYGGSSSINDYRDLYKQSMNYFDELIDNILSENYITICRRVTSDNGEEWRSLRIQSPRGDKYSYLALVERNKQLINLVKSTKLTFAALKVSGAAATTGLLELAPQNIREHRKLLKDMSGWLKDYEQQFKLFVEAKERENEIVGRLIKAARTVDGVESTELEIFVK